jgi:hypothetical protein
LIFRAPALGREGWVRWVRWIRWVRWVRWAGGSLGDEGGGAPGVKDDQGYRSDKYLYARAKLRTASVARGEKAAKSLAKTKLEKE